MEGTEESFLSMHGNAPQLLQIATHGFYYTPERAAHVDYLKGYSDAMMLSGIVLSGGNAAWRGGLQRAFKKAGVGTMVMALWSVSDKVATEFMTAFYEQLASKQCKWNKRKAFENAKSIIREKYPDPYYWAAFVMLD